MSRLIKVSTIVLALGLSVSSANAEKMYWAEASLNKIQRANLDGTFVEDIVALESGSFALALDPNAEHVYWIVHGKIQRADFDGTNVVDLVTGLDTLRGMALDTQGGKMYWMDRTNDKIQRANLDGTGVEDLVAMGTLNDPGSIVLDVAAGMMYWSDSGASVIRRANMEIPDGEIPTSRTDIEEILTVSDGLDEPWGLAVDSVSQKIYWTDKRKNTIQRANLDGSGIEELVTGLNDPRGITLELVSGKMYWVDSLNENIQRADLNGSNLEDLVTSGLVSPFDIDIELSPPPTCEGVNDCSGNGLCIAPDTCFCDSGWQGADCAAFDCSDLNNCSGHGTCVGPNTCLCDSAFIGETCAVSIPAVSEWGLAIMSLAVLTAGTLTLRRRIALKL